MKVRKLLCFYSFCTGGNSLRLPELKENRLPLPLSQQADKISITGSVVDSKESSDWGCILEEGTTNGTITDFDGNFSCVSAGARIDISYIGYMAAKPSHKCWMEVVAALGIKPKKSMGYKIKIVMNGKSRSYHQLFQYSRRSA